MRPTRVLLIAPSFDIVGGQAVQASRLLEELRKSPEIEIDFLPVNPRAPRLLRPLQKIKYVRTLLTGVLYGIHLLTRIRKYDILHIFTPGYFPFLQAPVPAILLARLLGKKTILNYRDGRAEDHLATSSFAVRMIRRVDAVVVPSKFLVNVFAKFGLAARSIPNIVDLQRFHFRERGQPRPVFLHNRGLEPLYNVACTIRAFALVQKRYPDATLTIAHFGTLRKQLEAFASDLKLRNVTFTGPISREQTAEAYDQAGIYVMSPNIDNFPPSVLECFAAGLPIISTAVGGIPYILEHERTALLVQPDDADAIAAAAFRLLEEPGLAARLARNGRQECRKYDPSTITTQWLELYSTVSAADRPRAADETERTRSVLT